MAGQVHMRQIRVSDRQSQPPCSSQSHQIHRLAQTPRGDHRREAAALRQSLGGQCIGADSPRTIAASEPSRATTLIDPSAFKT